MLLILGMVDLTRAWQSHQAITDAARAGARALVVDNNLTETQVDSIIQWALIRNRLDPGIATITVPPRADRGDYNTVQIIYPYTFKWISPVMIWITGGNTINLDASITMRSE
jgi:hypothetical protein